MRWRIDKKYVDIFRGFLETNLRPVPPHDIIFPSKEPTSCNIWTKEVFINEREEREGELEWAYRHECGHLSAFPRTVGEDFKNFYRAKDEIVKRGYSEKAFTKYYPLIANIAYDLIIDTELIMNYPSIREKAKEFLVKAKGLPAFISNALRCAVNGSPLSWIEPDAPHKTIVYVYEELRDVLEGKDEEYVMAFFGLGCPSPSSGPSSACAGAPMGGAKSEGGEGDGQSDGGRGKRKSGEQGSESERGCGGGLGEQRGQGKSGEGSKRIGKQANAGEASAGGDEEEAEEGRRGPSPEGSGDGRGGGHGEGGGGEERAGREEGRRSGQREEGNDVGGRVEGKGEEGQRSWPSLLDIEHGPVSYVDVIPVAAELIEEGKGVDIVATSIAEYIESIAEWREKLQELQGQGSGGGSGGQRGRPSGGAGFGRENVSLPALKELVLDAYVERCFSLPLQVLPRKEGFVGVLPRERSTVWRLGDPIDELDVRETVRSYGVLVPGHTAVRTREVPVVQRVGRLREGGADVMVIVDQSGSMDELMPYGPEKWKAARNTALALLGWARYIGANARVVTFSDTVLFDSGWVGARKIKSVAMDFASRYYPFNNTVLSEALIRIDRPRATVYVIGDFKLGDWQHVRAVLPKLASLDVLLILLLIGNEHPVRQMAGMAREAGVKVKAYAVDTPKAMLENALRELKI